MGEEKDIVMFTKNYIYLINSKTYFLMEHKYEQGSIKFVFQTHLLSAILQGIYY